MGVSLGVSEPSSRDSYGSTMISSFHSFYFYALIFACLESWSIEEADEAMQVTAESGTRVLIVHASSANALVVSL